MHPYASWRPKQVHCPSKGCSIVGTLMASKKKRTRLSRQAPALSQRQWKLWLEWLLNTAGARIYFVIFLTGAFGLRCSEALALKREDLIINGAIPKVRVTGDTAGARKSPGDVYIREQHLKTLKAHLAKGIQSTRAVKHKHGKGKKKQIKKNECYEVPTDGYIFTSRKGSKDGHLHYHAVYDHVVRQAPFVSSTWRPSETR